MALEYETYTEVIKSTAIRTVGTGSRYRISLTRIWNENMPIVVFLCVNPSYADELNADNTVSVCGNLAASMRDRFGGYTVLNLYSHYATDPRDCEKDGEAADDNAKWVACAIKAAHTVVIACGNDQKRRLKRIFSLIGEGGEVSVAEKLYCLKKNSGGGFLHPRSVTLNDLRTGKYKTLVRIDLAEDVMS